MPGSGSPLLDQYDQDGIVTPGIQRAMEIFKQNNIQQIPGQEQPGIVPRGTPQAQPTPLVGGSGGPQGGQGLVPSPNAPTPAAAPSPHQTELNRLTQTGSGTDQVKNPWLRLPLQVLGAIGTGFAPRLTSAIPGTDLHHQMLVNREQGALNQESTRATAESGRQHQAAEDAELGARGAHETAEANALAHPQPKEEESGKTITTDQGIMQWNPDTKRYDIQAGKAPEKPTKEAGTVHQLEDGSLVIAHPDGTATAVTLDGKPVKGEAKTPPKQSLEEQAVAEYKASHPNASTTEALEYVKTHTAPPDKNDHGQNFIDPATNKLVRVGPGGSVPAGAVTAAGENTINTPTTQARNAGERSTTMLDLDARIRSALKNPEILKGTGPLAGRLSEMENRLGTLPHDLSELKNDLKSYGAFQAGLHPVRGIGGLEYFDKVMGGLGQTPEELLGKLDSNKATAESVKKVAHQGGPAAGAVENGYRFKGGDPKQQANWEKVP